MFDDIIKKKTDIKTYDIKAFCPSCGSTDLLYTGKGVFLPGRKYRQEVICNICHNIWHEVINENMEVIKIEK